MALPATLAVSAMLADAEPSFGKTACRLLISTTRATQNCTHSSPVSTEAKTMSFSSLSRGRASYAFHARLVELRCIGSVKSEANAGSPFSAAEASGSPSKPEVTIISANPTVFEAPLRRAAESTLQTD